jgi:hypothetical protein
MGRQNRNRHQEGGADQMKNIKLLMIIIIVLAALVSMSGVAQASFAIHGGYLADTDACAGCHRAHTATSAVTWIDNAGSRRSALLVGPPTTQVYIFCYVCHSSGAPGAATDVEGGVLDSTSPGGAVEGANSGDMSAINTVLNGGGFELLGNDIARPATSTHEVKGAAWQAWGGDENIAGYVFMDCCSCHDPHGSSNYRSLKDYVNGHWVGGYSTSAGSVIGGVDPDPLPFVISNETGYPLKGSPVPAATPTGTSTGPISSAMLAAPTNGFRLHRQYNNGDLTVGNYNGGYEYIPSFTKARYARGENATMVNQYDPNKGMSAWCCACHENYMARTSISRWAIGSIGQGNANPGAPGSYPIGAGVTTVLVTTLTSPVSTDAVGVAAIPVADISGFPDPADENVNDIKYIGLWGDGDTIMTNEGAITLPKFEMVAYDGLTGNAFDVPNDGRGAFDTSAQSFAAGSLVYLGYDASDGYGDLVRHRHPMNVPLSNWQNAQYNPTWVAGDRALVVNPADWQNFESNIPFVDIPLDHDAGYPPVDAFSEQGSQDFEIQDWIECLTCHRAHGTDATMSGFAGATLAPVNIQGYDTLMPNPGTDDGVPPTGDSALLRDDNRGVCERCHNK